MNPIRYALLLVAAALFACQKPAPTQQEETPVEEVVPALSQAYLDSLAAIPLAIPESPEASRQPTRLSVNPGLVTGLPFNLSLPEKSTVQKIGEAKFLVSNPDSTFLLVVVKDESTIEDLRQVWKTGFKGVTLGQFLLDTPNGLLIEAIRNGKREYHVEYLHTAGETAYRLYSDQKHVFSRSQAERMFHACRMLEGGGR